MICPLAPLLSSFSSEHASHCFTLNTFSWLKNAVCNIFWVYFGSNFLQRIMRFLLFESVSFCTLQFLREQRSRSWSFTDLIQLRFSAVIQDKAPWSILSPRTISAGVEWVAGWSPQLKIIYFNGLIFLSLRAELDHPEPSFRAAAPVSAIFIISFFTLFASHLYSRWSLTILVGTYLYFIWR